MKKSAFLRLMCVIAAIACLAISETCMVFAKPAKTAETSETARIAETAGITEPAAAVITDSQKKAYYEQYQSILEEAAEQTKIPVKLIPFDEMQDEYWISPEEYKKDLMENLRNIRVRITDAPKGVSPAYASTTKSKNVTFEYGKNLSFTLKVTGSFRTILSETAERQVFGGINYITAEKVSGTGTWTYDGYTHRMFDGGRECDVYVSGNIRHLANVYPVDVGVQFYCSSTGVVS